MVSLGVVKLKVDLGIVITVSHNLPPAMDISLNHILDLLQLKSLEVEKLIIRKVGTTPTPSL